VNLVADGRILSDAPIELATNCLAK